MNSENNPNGKNGAIIRKMRLQLGLSQTQVANALHVTPGYISNIENNRATMSLPKLILYAKLLNVTVDELAGLLHPDYTGISVNNQLLAAINKLNPSEQLKLLRMIQIYQE